MIRLNAGLSAWQRWADKSLDDRDRTRDRRELALILAAVAFIFLNAIAFSLVEASALSWSHLYAPSLWAGTVIVAHLVLRVARPRRDPFLLPIFALLAGWGLLLQDRLAPNFLGRQTLWFVLAAVALLLVAILPRTLQPLMRYRYTLLTGGLILLAITLIFGVNPSGQGAALWLPIPFPFLGTVYFQPSELLKLLLVVFLASYFTELDPLYHYRKETTSGRGGNAPNRSLSAFQRHLPFLGPLLFMWGFTLLLLVWQQDLGAAALFFIVFIIMLYLATGEKIYTLSGIALLLLAGVIAFFAFDTVVAPRVLSWLNPWPNVSDRAYQIVQALYAQAAGGVFGQGIGQGYPDFIPVVHSDFALAAISEEWGLIGSLSIVGCFAVLALRGLRTATRAIQGARPQYFHAYVAAGLVTLFSVQAFLIMGGVTKLLPLTGITLPLVSYGGSSMLVSSLAIGLLLYISADAETITPGRTTEPGLARRIERLGIAILLTFAVVALTLTYWSVIRADSLLAREDNPRLIEAERRVHRGQIVDRHGTVLAETTGPADGLARFYPLAEDEGPAVGYYSLRFGSAGVEEAYDAHLRGRSESFWGDALRRLFHAPFTGTDVRLTLDATLQREATQLMRQANAPGALVLLEIVTVDGEPVADIRAMVSSPGYDPNQIDDEFDTLSATDPGPLFNRATQGLYQPGLIVQPLIMAAAVDDGRLNLDETLIAPFAPVTLHGQQLRCEQTAQAGEAPAPTWRTMGRWRCPAPLQALGDRLDRATLEAIFNRFGLYRSPDLPIPAAGASIPVDNPGRAAIGQDTLTITPLQAALATAALAGDGHLPGPRLVESLAGTDGQWTTQPAGAPTAAAAGVSSDAAAAILDGWLAADGASTFAATTLAGPEDSRNAWLLGVTTTREPRFVLALVLEGEADTIAAEAIGQALLRTAMSGTLEP